MLCCFNISVPDDEVSVGTSVYFEHDGSPVIILDIEVCKLHLQESVLINRVTRKQTHILSTVSEAMFIPEAQLHGHPDTAGEGERDSASRARGVGDGSISAGAGGDSLSGAEHRLLCGGPGRD